MDDSYGQLGRWWYISLPVALLIVFPIALDLVSGTFGIIPQTRGRIDERPGRQLSPSHIRLANDVWFDRPVSSTTVSRKPDVAVHLGFVVLAVPHPSATRDTRAVVGSRPANPGLPEIRCHHHRDLGFPATHVRIRSPLYSDRQVTKRPTNPNRAALIARFVGDSG